MKSKQTVEQTQIKLMANKIKLLEQQIIQLKNQAKTGKQQSLDYNFTIYEYEIQKRAKSTANIQKCKQQSQNEQKQNLQHVQEVENLKKQLKEQLSIIEQQKQQLNQFKAFDQLFEQFGLQKSSSSLIDFFQQFKHQQSELMQQKIQIEHLQQLNEDLKLQKLSKTLQKSSSNNLTNSVQKSAKSTSVTPFSANLRISNFASPQRSAEKISEVLREREELKQMLSFFVEQKGEGSYIVQDSLHLQ